MKIQTIIYLPMVAILALFCAPNAGFAQSILGSAGQFTLLGGTSVTSTGTTGTIIQGNVGAAAANGVTGFPPAVATGTIHNGADGVVNQALTDLTTAQVGLSGMATNVNESNVDLGGLTLYPDVYTFGSAASQNGTLTLNANGQDNVFWVFQIGTSLTTSLNSAVILINSPDSGASDGIFWDAKAGITIGADSTILGNYLAGTSITFGGTTSGSGGARALAAAGVSLDTNLDSPNNPNGGSWAGALVFKNGQVVPVTVPEPAAFLWLAPLGAMGLAIWRRRTAANQLVS